MEFGRFSELKRGFFGIRRKPVLRSSKKIASFASFSVDVVECANPAFDQAFDLLKRLRHEITEEDYHASQILDRTYGFFLRVSRVVSIADSVSGRSEKELSYRKRFADLSVFHQTGTFETVCRDSRIFRTRH